MSGRFALPLATLVTVFALLNSPAAMSNAFAMGFTDVSAENPASASIEYLTERGIVNGYPDGRFGPGDALTRAAATKIASQVMGLAPRPNGGQLGFSDLGPEHWAAPFVRAGVENGLVTGFEDRTFQPDVDLTRAQLAALAIRATRQSMSRIPALSLGDVRETDWFHRPVVLAVASGMMAAPDGQFRPGEKATRAEAAQAFARAIVFTPLGFDRPFQPRVEVVRGKVELLAPNASAYVQVSANTLVPPGARIRTGAASGANIAYPDGSTLYLDDLSEVMLMRSQGTELVGGTALEELEVRLVRGRVFAAVVTRQEAVAGTGAQPALADAQSTHVQAAATAASSTLPSDASRIVLYATPATIAPGDTTGTELTVMLANSAGEPVVALEPVQVSVRTTAGTISSAVAVIAAGSSRTSVRLTPPATAPDDAKTRITASVGGLSAEAVVPTEGAEWWRAPFTKKVRARLHLPWATVQIRGSVVSATATSQENSLSVLTGDATLQSLSGLTRKVTDTQRVRLTSPDKAPSAVAAWTIEDQLQWTNQRTWVQERIAAMSAVAPPEIREQVKQEASKIQTIVETLPRDATPPRITMRPPDPLSGAAVLTVKGSASDNSKLAGITVNGIEAAVSPGGDWAATVSLVSGDNNITATASDSSGNFSSASATVRYDPGYPTVTLSGPAYTRSDSVVMSGNVNAAAGLKSLKVNGQSAVIDASGGYSITLSLVPGKNAVIAEVTDALDQWATADLAVVSAPTPPEITIAELPPAINQPLLTVSGTVTSSAGALSAVTVNGSAVLWSGNGSFQALIKLNPGMNEITVVAEDLAGNRTAADRRISFSAGLPTVSLRNPGDGQITGEEKIPVDGRFTAPAGLQTLLVNGAQVVPNPTGSFSRVLTLTPGPNAVEAIVTDAIGQTSSVVRTVTFMPVPPLLTVAEPKPGANLTSQTVRVSGKSTSKYGIVSVMVGAVTLEPAADGAFEATITLGTGAQSIPITVWDKFGQTGASIAVRVNPVVAAPPPPPVTAPAPKQTALSVQAASTTYSDEVTLRAGLSAGLSPVSGKEITFRVGEQVVGTAATAIDGSARVSLPVNFAPGLYEISASFSGDAGHTASSGTAALTVATESATLVYVGAEHLSYGTAVVTASVRQDSDGRLGEAENLGTVRFVITRKSDGALVQTFDVPVNADAFASITLDGLPNATHVVTASLTSSHFQADGITAEVAASEFVGEILVQVPAQAKVGERFIATISLKDVEAVRASAVNLTYDPGLIRATRLITSSSVLAGLAVRQAYDNTRGLVEFITALTGTKSFSGAGTLFQVEFQVVASGTVSLSASSGDPLGPLHGLSGYTSPLLGSAVLTGRP